LGIVFLESRNLGWEVIVQSYFMKQFPEVLSKYKSFIEGHIFYCLRTSLEFIKIYGVFPLVYSDIQLVKTFFAILSYYFEQFRDENVTR